MRDEGSIVVCETSVAARDQVILCRARDEDEDREI